MALLGCIADDFTGATDLPRCSSATGCARFSSSAFPAEQDPPPDADAVVVALKSRTIACRGRRRAEPGGARTGCSVPVASSISSNTARRSTARMQGNIGPVADALIAVARLRLRDRLPRIPRQCALGLPGPLFVGSVAAERERHAGPPAHADARPESRARPVPSDRRRRSGSCRLLRSTPGRPDPRRALRVARAGTALRDRRRGERRALIAIGEAVAAHALVTGGSGVAMGLPENFRRLGKLARQSADVVARGAAGHAAVLAGSCSRATLLQVANARDRVATLELDPLATPDPDALIRQALDWATGQARRRAGRDRRVRAAGSRWPRCRPSSAATRPAHWSNA